jgi:GNAT superfamily N-acetyltransferase
MRSREGAVIEYRISPSLTNDALNALFAAAWSDHESRDFSSVLSHSLGFVGAFSGERLVGFVNLAWDGGVHAFLLDTTVDPEVQRRGIGAELVTRAVELARECGCTWVHVDFEAQLEPFYARGGFAPTRAGLVRLK